MRALHSLRPLKAVLDRLGPRYGHLMVVLCVGALPVSCGRRPVPPVDAARYEALGSGVARVGAELIGGSGEAVLVFPDWGARRAELEGPVLRGLTNALVRFGAGLSLSATMRLQYEDLLPGQGFAGARYKDLIRRWPETDVVISLAGLPVGDIPARDVAPALVAYMEAATPEHAGAVVENGVANAVVLPRPPAPGPAQPEDPDPWSRFRRLFHVVR
jgi:hypothetical protein